jgi:hypothetical protein
MEMQNTENQNCISLGRAWMLFFGGLAAIVGLFYLFNGLAAIGVLSKKAIWPVGVLLSSYFAIGIILGKVVFCRLIVWHPVYNTVSNVVSTKITQIVFWPFAYPYLFVSLFISKKM